MAPAEPLDIHPVLYCWPSPSGWSGAWSVLNLPEHRLQATATNQLFWLAALPGLSGATLRIFYSFMVPMFGGRKWTALSTASLLIPAIGIGFAVQRPRTPATPRWPALALLCGFGGGNFSSSVWPISAFSFPRPRRARRWA